MKRLVNSVIVIALSSILFACQSEEAVSFPDQQLEEAIRSEIDESGDITISDLEGITELDLSGLDIESLNGIDSLNSLETLSLQNNSISDFSVLEQLTELKTLNVAGNQFEKNEEQVAILDNLSEQGIEVIFEKEIEVVGKEDGPGGFLWKVEDENTEIYLQGTIHVGIEEFYPLNRKIEQAYAESDVVVPEIDITTIDQSVVEKLNMELGTYQDGSTIQDHISEELYTDVSEAFMEYGVPMEMIKNYKPWILSNTLQQLMMQQAGFIEGVDEYFLNRAASDGKEVIDLETIEGQLSIFANTSHEFQVEGLEESLIEFDTFEKQMYQLLHAYKDGDKERLLTGLMDETETEPSAEEKAYMEKLNDERNYQMAEKIISFLEEDQHETYFVIVGALHFLEDPHIRTILEEDGYVVEEVH